MGQTDSKTKQVRVMESDSRSAHDQADYQMYTKIYDFSDNTRYRH